MLGSQVTTVITPFPALITDVSGTTTPYNLQVGETISRSYSSATTVELYTIVGGGIYELFIQNNGDTGTAYDSLNLYPNSNTGYTNAFDWGMHYIDTVHGVATGAVTSTDYTTGQNNTFTGWPSAGFGHITISTAIKCKILQGTATQVHYVNNSTSIRHAWWTSRWYDTTTAWTSLGQILFNGPMTGTITIKRIS